MQFLLDNLESYYSDTAENNGKFVVSSGISTRIFRWRNSAVSNQYEPKDARSNPAGDNECFSAVSDQYESSFHNSDDGTE